MSATPRATQKLNEGKKFVTFLIDVSIMSVFGKFIVEENAQKFGGVANRNW